MKILFLSEYYSPFIKGGAEISLQILSEELAKSHEVHVLTPNYFSYKNMLEKKNGVFIHRYKSKRVFFQSKKFTSFVYKKSKPVFDYLIDVYSDYSSRSMERALNKIGDGFNIVHANNMESSIALARSDIPAKKISYLRDYRLIPHLKKLKTIDHFIVISNFLKSKYYKLGKGKLTVIYNPVHKLNFLSKKKTKTILFTGFLTKKKGIETINFLSKNLQNYKFLVVGEGPDKDLIDHRKNIKFLGYLKSSEMKKFYRFSEFLIVPSFWEEPFGRVVVEGQSAGCVVIARKRGGIKELIKNGKTGFFAEKDLEFLKTIKSISREKIFYIRKNCKKYVRNFYPEKISERVLSVYRKVIK